MRNRSIVVPLIVCLVIGFCLSASADDVYNKEMEDLNIAVKNMMVTVNDQRDKACPKQEQSFVCEMEFNATMLKLMNISMSLSAIRLHAVMGNKAGMEDQFYEAKEGLVKLSVRLEELVIKYNK